MADERKTNVKQRAARIPLDYFQHKSALERSKLWLSAAAVLVALGYVAWGAFTKSAAARVLSPGKLAAVHAMWDNRCEMCHQAGSPLSADAWTIDSHASDQLCKTCHQGAEHSHNQITAEVVSCSACHHDHQGRDARLIRVADNDCTVCHANLPAHLKPGAKPIELVLASVTSFVENHPDFRSTKHDPGTLRFSHSRHLRPGLTFGLGPLTLGDLSPADRSRYAKLGQTEKDLVTLDCASCHQLDRSGDATKPNDAVRGVARPAGDYMLPINYDMHCKACHQLSYVGREKPVESATPTPRYLLVKTEDSVPHGWTGNQLQRYVEQVLDMKFMQSQNRDAPTIPSGDIMHQPLDRWRLPGHPPKPESATQTVGEYLKGELQAAEKNLRVECVECHQMSPQPESLEVQPVAVHPAWFAFAKFSHVAHRAIDCQSCHAGAFPSKLPDEPTPTKTVDNESVFIPGRQLCLKCHSPSASSGDTATGGVRFDCAECHNYHSADSPWHGPGVTDLAPKHPLTIEEFIDGGVRDEK